jgi:hypothetical protein
MSSEDIGEARAKRDAKEKAIASKGKRGRKRKSPEEEEVGPSAPKVVRMSDPASVMEGTNGEDVLGQLLLNLL